MDGGAWQAAVHRGCEESDMTEQLHFHFSLSCTGEGNGNPLQCSCLENPREGETGGLLSVGSRRVGHDRSDLAAACIWRGAWHPTPAFLPGESQGWWSLVGCHLWGRTGSDTSEAT